jgi:fatty acid-binding protein DegV
MGTVLSMKPRLHVDIEGRLINHGKIRGRKASLLGLVEEMRQNCDEKDHDTIAICHGDCEEEAQFVLEEARKHFNIKNAIINPLAAAIGTHVGPGCMAIFFIGKKRTE